MVAIKSLFPLCAIGHIGKYHNPLCFALKFCISIIFVFSWDHCKSQEKLETMLIQNLGEQTKSVMVFSKMAYRDQLASLESSISLYFVHANEASWSY